MRRLAPLPLLALLLPALACRDARTVSSTVSTSPAVHSPPAPLAAANPAADAAKAPESRESDAALCAVAVRARVTLTGKPFAPRYPHCPESEPFCDTIDVPPDRDACFVANRNIARAEGESHASHGAKAAAKAWDGATPPQYLDRVDAHLHLTPIERERLRENGFVVLDRVPYADYASAFHDVFQEQLPLFVGVDPAMHAVFRGTELVLERIEEKRLKPALTSLLRKLRGGLRAAKGRLDADTAADLDVYLGVAQGLADPSLREKSGLSLFGHDDEIESLLALADAAEMTDPERGIPLFGRARVIDFSQLTPRGHYAHSGYGTDDGLEHYFQAVMWLSRLEWNLVSRSCRSSQPGMTPNPEETPREAVDAMTLAEIAQASGALVELKAFEDVYAAFAGKREDVSIPALLALEQRASFRASDARAPEKLKAAIGNDYVRTARFHFMPQGAPTLPVIATLLGARVVPDTAGLTRLVHDRVPERYDLGAADVAYALGHDRAKRLLKEDLAQFSDLQRALDAARADTRRGTEGNDVYAHWLRAVVALSAEPSGALPSFVFKDAYRDMRMSSALVGFGQLRHAFVLLAAQGYDAYGCEIPDAYVEPLVPVWDALVDHVRNVRRSTGGGFAGLERVLTMLRDIARTEASGAALSEAQRRWLGMVAEHVPNGGYQETSEPPKWTGWYFDMFEDREIGASRTSAFVADYFTLTNASKVKYLGADGPRLGVFVVDAGGAPRVMVGPVAKGYETESPIEQRLDDEKALAHAPKRAPWRETFAVPETPAPALGLVGKWLDCAGDAGPAERRYVMRAARPIGNVSITMLDHHADPLGPAATVDVGTAWTAIAFAMPDALAKASYGIEAVHVHVDDLAAAGLAPGAFDRTSSPSVFAGKEPVPDALPERWKGVGDFEIGGEKR